MRRLNEEDQFKLTKKDTFLELLGKLLRLADAAYHTTRPSRFAAAASALKLMVQHGLNPKVGQQRPEDVIETGLCKKLDDSGFIDAIERNQ